MWQRLQNKQFYLMMKTRSHSDISDSFMDSVTKVLDNMKPGEWIHIDKLKNKGVLLTEKEREDFRTVVRWYIENGWADKYNQIDFSTKKDAIFMTTVKGFKRKSIIKRK